MTTNYNGIIVPMGKTKEDIKKREQIISQVYRDFYKNNPDRKIKNNDLNADINIRYLSITETIRHASKRFLSTLAVLQLEAVLTCAKRTSPLLNPKPGVKNQENFSKLFIMTHTLPCIGEVKLTVGINKKNGKYIQYCLTAINA